ncbi:hypothetical protein RAN3_3820 [plant metagenome]|uniref:Uncharacterized protein n=1 Tax=plant metagenome TaxID=1297885 RepID=A0A484UTK4_9ZZZZ
MGKCATRAQHTQAHRSPERGSRDFHSRYFHHNHSLRRTGS